MTRTVTSTLTCDLPEGMTLTKFYDFLRNGVIGAARHAGYSVIAETTKIRIGRNGPGNEAPEPHVPTRPLILKTGGAITPTKKKLIRDVKPRRNKNLTDRLARTDG